MNEEPTPPKRLKNSGFNRHIMTTIYRHGLLLAILLASVLLGLLPAYFSASKPSAISGSGRDNKGVLFQNASFKLEYLNQIELWNSSKKENVSSNSSSAKVAIPFGDAGDLTRPRNSLQKRDVDLDILKSQGNQLLCLMNQPDNPSIEGKWFNGNQAHDYGWRLMETSSVDFPFMVYDIHMVIEALGASLDISRWHNLGWDHDRYYSQDGVDRVGPTGAEYDSWANFEDKMLIPIIMYSPKYNVGRFGGTIPNLNKWSDLNFISWYTLSNGAPDGSSRIDPPENILIYNIQSIRAITEQIVEAVTQELDVAHLPTWPGLIYSTETEEGKALLATPHGKAVSWFLIQHKRQFGVVRVSEIYAFVELGVFCLNFKVEAVPEDQVVAEGGHPEGSPVHSLQKREVREREIDPDLLMSSGNDLLCNMNSPPRADLRGTFFTEQQLVSYGWHKISDSDIESVINEVFGALSRLQIDPAGFECQTWRHRVPWSKNGILEQPTNADFGTLWNFAARVLIPFHMFSPKGVQSGTNPTTIPPANQWSDITFSTWYAKFAPNDKTGTLRIPAPHYIIIPDIQNPVSEEAVDEVLRRRGLQNAPLFKWPGATFATDSDEGKILLGTPHGRAVSMFLIQHKEQFGVMKISSIDVWGFQGVFSSVWCMNFKIEEVPNFDTEDQTQLLKRQVISVSDLMARGHALLCLMNGPNRDEIRGTWYTIQNLADQGWSLLDLTTAWEYHMVPLVSALNGLNIPIEESTWQWLSWSHGLEWNHQGVMEQPTFGSYQSWWNFRARTIIATGMYSPRYMSEQLFDQAVLPPARQWNQLQFAAWYEALAGNDGGIDRVDPPQNIIIYQISSATLATEEAMAAVLGRLGVSHIDNLGSWPGRNVAASSDEGKIMLGTPHGAAVSWFFINYKDQMGNVRVESIDLFLSQRGSLCLNFRIEMVPDDEVLEGPFRNAAGKAELEFPWASWANGTDAL